MFTRISSAVESVELKPCSSESADQLKMGNSTQTGGNATELKDPAQEAPAAAAIMNNKRKKKGISGFMKRTRKAISNAALCCVRGNIERHPLGVQAKTQDEVNPQPVDSSKQKNIKAPTIVISYPCSDSVDPSKQKNIKDPTIVISYPCSDTVDLQPRSSGQSGNKLPISMDLPDPQPAPQPAPVSDSSNLSSVSESGSVQESSILETEPESNPSVEEKPDRGQTELELSPVPGPTTDKQECSSIWEYLLQIWRAMMLFAPHFFSGLIVFGSNQPMIHQEPTESPSLPNENVLEPTPEHHQELFSDPELPISMDLPDPQPVPVSDSSNLSSVSESGSVQESSSLETKSGSNPSVEEKPGMGQTELEPSPVPGPSNLSLVSESGSVPGPSSLKPKPGLNPFVKKKYDRGQTELKLSHVPGTTGSFSSFYDLQGMLGMGFFGTVYEAVRKSDGQMVAVKFVEKFRQCKFHALPEYSRPLFFEVAVNLVLQKPPASPYIIKMLDWFEEPKRHVMIMEYPHPCKNLRDFIRDKGGSLDETVASGLFRQVVLAVKHCTDRGIIHNDIKSANMVVNTETLQLKLIDFGCSKFSKENAGEKTQNVISYLRSLLSEMVKYYNCPVSTECLELVRRFTHAYLLGDPTLDEILEYKWLNQG